MNYLGYAHWALVIIFAAICLLKKWQGANVAPKPFIAGGVLICAGIALALSDGDFKKTGFLDFMLFTNVDYASTVIAIGYSFLVFGLVSPIASMMKEKKLEESSERTSVPREQRSEDPKRTGDA